MHENKNSRSIIHVISTQLHTMDNLVQVCDSQSRCYHTESFMVCCAPHSAAISHDKQLFLDVLRRHAPAPCARCRFYQGQCGDANIQRDWMDTADSHRCYLCWPEIERPSRKHIVSNDSIN